MPKTRKKVFKLKKLAALTIGLLLSSQSCIAAPAKQSIALVPGGASAPPVVLRSAKSQAPRVSRTQIRNKARSAYPRMGTHLERAKYFKQRGNVNAALVEYLRATQENPRLLEAYYEQAVIFRQRGFSKLAESSLERALVVNKDFHQARILLATVRLEQGNFGGAVEELSRTLGLARPAIRTVAPAPEESKEPASGDSKGSKGFKDSGDEIESAAASVLQSLHERLPEGDVPSEKENRDNQTGQRDDEKQVWDEESKQDDPFFSIQVRLPNPLKMFHWLSDDSRDKRRASKTSKSKRARSERLAKSSDEAAENNGAKERKKRQPRSWLSKLMQVPEQPEGTLAKSEETATATDVAETKKTAQAESIAARQEKSQQENPTQVEEKVQPAKPPTETAPVDTIARVEPVAEINSAQPASAEPENATQQIAEKPWNLPLPSFTASGFFAAFNRLCPALTTGVATENKPPEPEDEWLKRLRYLNENGTQTLKDGEAFMFSEDTGEAVLILANGKRIIRTIATPQDAQEVLKLRRPDVLIPQDLMYNLSLLGRLMPKEETESQKNTSIGQQQPTQPPSEIEKPFSSGEMLGKREGIFDWVRGVLRL